MKDLGEREEVEKALAELGRQMALRDADPVTILCCGASVLCFLGLISRRTLDVDAIAMIDAKGDAIEVEEFAPEMTAAIRAAGLSLGLIPDWFNASASAVLSRGLPPGAIERSAAQSREFGLCLTVFFMDRIDLVALKMYAALDPREGRRHAADLVEIDPSRQELRHGAEWMKAWPSSPAFRQALLQLLEGFDAADILAGD